MKPINRTEDVMTADELRVVCQALRAELALATEQEASYLETMNAAVKDLETARDGHLAMTVHNTPWTQLNQFDYKVILIIKALKESLKL